MTNDNDSTFQDLTPAGREIKRLEADKVGLVREIERLKADNARLAAALADIAEGKGEFNLDPLKHASNTIEHSVQVANSALSESTALHDLLTPFLGSVENLHSYDGKEGRREWVSRGDWLYPGQ